jgi:hypothetical protein
MHAHQNGAPRLERNDLTTVSEPERTGDHPPDRDNNDVSRDKQSSAEDVMTTHINVTLENVPAVAAQAWAALRAVHEAGRPRFVRVGNMPCVRAEDGLEALGKDTLAYWLARVAVFMKTTKSDGDKIVKPPRWVIDDMLAQRTPDLPEEAGQ